MSRSVAKTCTLTQSSICVRDYWIIFVNWHAASGQRTRSRRQRAEKLGNDSVLARFTADAQFAQSLLAERDTEYECERYDVLRFAHLPRTDRTPAQIRLGVSENSQMEHAAMRLVFLDIDSKQDIPDRFHYLGKPWLFMFKTEFYSEDEYVDYLERNPTHNLLMSNMGMDRIDMSDPKRHIEPHH